MDTMSYDLLYKKYGIRYAIVISIAGLAFMISLSGLLELVFVYFDLTNSIVCDYVITVGSRLLAFIFLAILAKKINLSQNIGYSLRGFGKAICKSYIGYAVALAFLVDSLTINFALKNTVNAEVLVYLIALNLSVGLFEEMLTRGISMNLIKRRIDNKFLVILIQALIFMGLHCVNYIYGVMTLRQLKTQLVVTLVMGLYYGYVYEKTNSFFAMALLHGFYDFCVSSSLFFDPTGEIGVVYSKVQISVALYAVLFIVLFLAIKLFVKSVTSIKMYKEELS